jgi:hypothetical protein
MLQVYLEVSSPIGATWMKQQQLPFTRLKLIEPMYARVVNELSEGNESLYETGKVRIPRLFNTVRSNMLEPERQAKENRAHSRQKYTRSARIF